MFRTSAISDLAPGTAPWEPRIPTVGLRSIRGEGAALLPGGDVVAVVRKPIKEHELLDAIASATRRAESAARATALASSADVAV